jgi:methionyl-tRNA formyltransferase
LHQPENINASDFIGTLRTRIRPDLLVSLAASQIFGRDVLEIPSQGSINLHSGPLPRYQGMMPNFWTLVNGEPQGAVTVHYMAEKLDAGDIILQRLVPIHPSDSLHSLILRSKQIGVHALADAIQQIEQGKVRRQPMDMKQATYFSFPTRADARRLLAQGRCLL